MAASAPGTPHLPDRTLPADTRVVGAVVGHRTVLSVSGEIDMATTPLLAGAIDEALGNGAHDLWIDLTQTEFMDSSGLHALLDARRRAHALNRRLAVICPAGPVHRVIEITGLVDALPLYPDRATAHRGA